jgi:hypothetical protein
LLNKVIAWLVDSAKNCQVIIPVKRYKIKEESLPLNIRYEKTK